MSKLTDKNDCGTGDPENGGDASGWKVISLRIKPDLVKCTFLNTLGQYLTELLVLEHPFLKDIPAKIN